MLMRIFALQAIEEAKERGLQYSVPLDLKDEYAKIIIKIGGIDEILYL